MGGSDTPPIGSSSARSARSSGSALSSGELASALLANPELLEHALSQISLRPAPNLGPSLGPSGVGGVGLPEALPGGPPTWLTPGFCYLILCRESARERMRKALGRNPFLSEVFAWLQRNSSEHSSARFRIVFGLDPLDHNSPAAFVQAHVEEVTGGLRLKQLMTFQTCDVRLGADLQGPTSIEASGSGASRMRVSGPAGGLVVHVPFSVNMRNTGHSVVFSPRGSTNVKALTAYFESAQLLSFSVSAHVVGGEQALLAVGFGASSAEVGGPDTFLRLPHSTFISGSNLATSVGEFSLPDSHGFGREVKAVAVGNPDPVLYLALDKGVASAALVKGELTLLLSGNGIPAPIGLVQAK